jgi:hypothetical protein
MPDDVLDYANRLNCVFTIERAITYDPRLDRLWCIPVHFNFSLKSSAGRADRRSIELHTGLLQATPAEFRATFLHEVAHVCEDLIYGKCTHSQTWWEAMIRLGEQPWHNRFHSIDACRSRDSTHTLTLDKLFPAARKPRT